MVAVGFMIRAAAVRVRWSQFLLDAVILVAGFGAFFWFLIIRPAEASTEVDVLKNTLSQVYIALNCILVLSLGVLLLAGAANQNGRSVPLLLSVGFIDHAARRCHVVGGQDHRPLPVGRPAGRAVRGLLPADGPGRDASRCGSARPASGWNVPKSLAQSLPYAAMLTALLVLVSMTHGDLANPATLMTIIVFGIGLLVMVRQSLVLREDALIRERRAARMVEERYASLIRNASDVIMTVAVGRLADVCLAGRGAHARPAPRGSRSTRACSMSGAAMMAERLRAFLGEVAASSGEPVGPVEVWHRARQRPRGARDRRQQPDQRSGRAGPGAQFPRHHRTQGLEEQLRQLAFHDPLTLLANRSLFRDRVQHALTLVQRGQSQVAVMFLDLDNFKSVNDSLGHDAGDRLLQAVAQRLVKSTRFSDTVARLGGDEFAILLEGVAAPAEVEGLAALAD